MKVEFPMLAALLLIATTLAARVQAQGIEQALFSMAIEYGVSGARSVVQLLRLSR